MTRKEIPEEIEKMADEERRQSLKLRSSEERKQQIRAAAEMMRDEYAAGGELTVFTSLDAEDFHDL